MFWGNSPPTVAIESYHPMNSYLSRWPPMLLLRGREDGGGIPVPSGFSPDVTYVTQRPTARISYLTTRKPRQRRGVHEYFVSTVCHSKLSFQQVCMFWLVIIVFMSFIIKEKKHVSNDQGINFVCHCQM